MLKSKLAQPLSLSCVENYFLAYFEDKIDLVPLYQESYLSFNTILNDFVKNASNFVFFSMERIQKTAQGLELISQDISDKFVFQKNKLNLIRVKPTFSEQFRLLPQREDHYIMITEMENSLFYYLNNYPISEGIWDKNEFEKFYDNRTLTFSLTEKTLEAESYKKNSMNILRAFDLTRTLKWNVNAENIGKINQALLVFKRVRKRIIVWFNFISTLNLFLIDQEFNTFCEMYLQNMEEYILYAELQMRRKRFDFVKLNLHFAELMDYENKFLTQVERRRIIL